MKLKSLTTKKRLEQKIEIVKKVNRTSDPYKRELLIRYGHLRLENEKTKRKRQMQKASRRKNRAA